MQVLHGVLVRVRTYMDNLENVTSSYMLVNNAKLPGGRNNRRRTQRFPLVYPIRYRLLDEEDAEAGGTGYTINLGSGGMLFVTEQTLNTEERVELCMAWPVKKDHQIPLELLATAKVVRCEDRRIAVEILQWGFRLQRQPER